MAVNAGGILNGLGEIIGSISPAAGADVATVAADVSGGAAAVGRAASPVTFWQQVSAQVGVTPTELALGGALLVFGLFMLLRRK